MELPNQFLEQMRELLGGEFPAYLESLRRPGEAGIRVNTQKISAEQFRRIAPFALEPVSWTENGFYVREGDPVTSHPYYYAGLYYVQEPSAMLPAALLGAKPGDRVLDLCAAPGGKATELGSRLLGSGVLAANDISHSRAKALLKNLELHGVGNVLVSSEEPGKLAAHYKNYFDKILVDAPCSGEGMFRKDPSMRKAYGNRGPSDYAPLQYAIADAAVAMLRPGGRMVYSTCTFSKVENEEVLLRLLREHPEMRVVPAPQIEGAVSLEGRLAGCVRLFPHRVRGEGHFAALLEKSGDAADGPGVPNDLRTDSRVRVSLEPWREFQRACLNRTFPEGELFGMEESLFWLPSDVQRIPKIRYLRTGLYLGECKKHGFEPSQALAMYLRREDAAASVSFSADDGRVPRYLRGESLELTNDESGGLCGWTLVCADGFPLGWGKWVNGSLRNKYHTAWRKQ